MHTHTHIYMHIYSKVYIYIHTCLYIFVCLYAHREREKKYSFTVFMDQEDIHKAKINIQ